MTRDSPPRAPSVEGLFKPRNLNIAIIDRVAVLVDEHVAIVATLGPSKKHCFACAAILDVRAELCPKCGVR